MLKYDQLTTGSVACKRILRFVLASVILLVCLQDQVTAQAAKGNLSGKILASDETSLESAIIELGKNTTVSNEKGQFSFTNLQPGNYVLKVSMLGFSKFNQSVSIKAGQDQMIVVKLIPEANDLNEVVVTGQPEAQSLRNSVYQVRTIDSKRIRLRGATNLQTILNTELGMRFSNDLTLGTTDIQLMGMSGQNVKILLDGVPMVDRGSTRESLGQIDINTVERIEIVEGPMSVIYGTDALAGVINIITKKTGDGSSITATARIQEETVGDEYSGLSGKGVHNQSVGLSWQKGGLNLSGNVTRNNFGGWQGASTDRLKAWMPKDQLLYTAVARYSTQKLNVWYRFNGTDETIKYLGRVNAENVAGDVDYVSKRWFHQAQAEYNASEKLSFVGALSYTDYSRRTLSTKIDFTTGRRTLDINASQDKSIFTTSFFRGTAQYKLSKNVFVLAGVDFSNNNSSGQRILGTPTINEYALFLSPEIKVGSGIKLSPGLRFLKNSVYDAPPVIPSFNGKITLNKSFDVRFGYARGFRSPALRELYFNFYDASHSIHGNENLKAEYSNSFNAFLVWNSVGNSSIRVNSTFGTFYNVFHDLIGTAVDPNDNSQTTYLNISLFKTTGFTLENKLFWKDLQATLGASYIARYNELAGDTETLGAMPDFTWSPEINSNLLYTFSKLGASLNVFYKFTGKRPTYQTLTSSTGVLSAQLAETAGFHMADVTATKSIGKNISLMAGVKNVFNVTNLNNTSQDSGGAHSTAGAVPMSYGRSYFLGLNVQWTKK